MKILSIETSCDETGISIMESAFASALPHQGTSDHITLLGNALASQIALHAQYGGVFPAMAKRAHAEKIVPLLKEALGQAGILRGTPGGSTVGTAARDAILSICKQEHEMVSGFVELFNTYQKPDIDYIAVTVGPGLEPALWVGINAAKVLSTIWNIPVIPVNHMEGHVVTAAVTEDNSGVQKKYTFQYLPFPLLALLVSGGHTELVLTKSYGDYEKIGQTRDDAVGEAFDKVARMLGLPYPGGPAISNMAKEFRASGSVQQFVFPRPMVHSGDYDFSFSGLKTAILYTIRDLTESGSIPLTANTKSAIACAFEDAAVEVLIKKTLKAMEEFHIETVMVGGGVAGNFFLRAQLAEAAEKKLPQTAVLFPEPWLATDNAVMIGLAACARILNNTLITQDASTLTAQGNLSIANI
jgi:N6-L-threonylcarbamoyladenine synthase